MLQPKATDDLINMIRPSLGTYLRYARAAAAPFLFLGIWGMIRMANSPHGTALFGVVLAIALPTYFVVFLHIKIAQIGWDDASVWKTGLLGKKIIRRSDIEGVSLRSVSPAWSLKALDQMIVYGADNRILLRAYFAYWSSQDLHQLKIAIGKGPSDMFPVPVSQRDFNREFPKGGSVIERHPNLTGIIGALVITVIICLGIAAVHG